MPRTLSPKEINQRKFWRAIDNTIKDKEQFRKDLEADIAAWEAAGGKVYQAAVGESGYTMSGGLVLAKYRENGLKKLNAPKKDTEDD